MDKINEVFTWMQNIELNQIIDVIVAIVGIILAVILSPLISYWISKIFHMKYKRKEIKQTATYTTVRNFIFVFGVYGSLSLLDLNSELRGLLDKTFRIAMIWTVAKAVADGFSKGKAIASKFRNKVENDPMINLIDKFVKFILYILAAYLTLQEFGFDLGGVLTGLGLSSAIIALAAQDTVKDIFSGLQIFWDKPFAIGDWIEVENAAGTVEEISFRSTKIRTTEDTIITLQNSAISSKNIINWGVIKKRVYKINLKLPLETEEAVVEKVLNRIRFILKYNKDVVKESVNANFTKIDLEGINIYIYLETPITNYGEYQKFCNKINLTLLNILETQNVKLAYPGQNVYIKREEVLKQEGDLKKVAKAKKREVINEK